MKPSMPSTAYAIIMVGIPGAGKTTFSSRFADTFSIPLFNLPKIKAAMGLDARQTALFFETIMEEVTKTGQTVVIEGFSDTHKERASIEKVCRRLKYTPIFVWVQTDTNESLKRATAARRGDEKVTEREFDALIEQFEPPETKEPTVVISGRHAYPTQLKVVLKYMASKAVRPRPTAATSAAARQARPRGRDGQVKVNQKR